MNCQSLSRFLLNVCKLEFDRDLLSDQIWADFHRDDIIYVLYIKGIPAKFQTLA